MGHQRDEEDRDIQLPGKSVAGTTHGERTQRRAYKGDGQCVDQADVGALPGLFPEMMQLRPQRSHLGWLPVERAREPSVRG